MIIISHKIKNCRRNNDRIDYYQKINCYSYYNNEGKYIKFKSPIELIMLDISTSGIGFLTQYQLNVDDILVINLYINKIPHEQLAKVEWIKKAGEMNRIGTELINISTSLFKQLKEYNG